MSPSFSLSFVTARNAFGHLRPLVFLSQSHGSCVAPSDRLILESRTTPVRCETPHLQRCRRSRKKASSSAAAYVVPTLNAYAFYPSPLRTIGTLTPSPQQSQGEQLDSKKARRSERHQSPSEEALKNGQLPTPLTHKASRSTDEFKEGTLTPPSQISSEQTKDVRSPLRGIGSPPGDTQPFSQFVYPPNSRSYAVEDEEGEGVWGYLVPFDDPSGDVLVLHRRSLCPVPGSTVGRTTGTEKVSSEKYKKDEEQYEEAKATKGVPAGGYLIGRHPECGKMGTTSDGVAQMLMCCKTAS